MKKFSIVATVLLMVAVSANAKVRRVGFFGTQVAGTDYVSFDAAQTASSPGDTIYMFPATTLTGTIIKKLIIIGNGTLLDPNTAPKGNANQQAFAGESIAGGTTLAPGSEGTVIMGFHNGTFYITASDITIRRNRDIVIYIAYGAGTSINNLKVLENYSVNMVNSGSTGYTSTNMNISNNMIYQLSTGGTNTYSGNISNNVWVYDNTAAGSNGGPTTFSYTGGITLGSGAYLFQNNILVSYANASVPSNPNYFQFTGGGNTVFNYNVALETNVPQAWGSGTGNIITPIANAANIFTAFPLIGSASADARYTLKGGSPALMANRPSSTADAGMYGGPAPYKLSTLPSIPSIYQLSSPDGNNPTGTSIQINLSTKGNN